MNNVDQVTAPIDARIVGSLGSCNTTVVLSWTASDPWAISLTIPTRSGPPIVWEFARELLADSLSGFTAGIGDVTITHGPSCAHPQLVITLDSPNGRAKLHVSRGAVAEFNDTVARMVPSSVGIDWDRELRQLARGLPGAGPR